MEWNEVPKWKQNAGKPADLRYIRFILIGAPVLPCIQYVFVNGKFEGANEKEASYIILLFINSVNSKRSAANK